MEDESQQGEMAEMQQMPPGGATKLAQQVAQGLMQLKDLLAKSGGTDEENQQMDQILQLFIDLVEKKLGGEGDEGSEPADQGQVPINQGPGSVPMGPQSKN